MIKFKSKDGKRSFEMNDQGNLKFEDEIAQKEFEDSAKEENVNNTNNK